jgi:polysaccharide pyruvyl transferase WcaK-like protein
LANILKKKYYILGHTIGPFFGPLKYTSRNLTRKLIKKATLTTLRDKNSFEEIDRLGLNNISTINASKETVFLYPLVKAKPSQLSGRKIKKHIAITIHHTYFKYWYSKEEYIKLMAQVVDEIHKGLPDYKINFFSMEKDRAEGDDKNVITEIINNCEHKELVCMKSFSDNPIYTIEAINDYDCMIATKTHSVVYGLINCIPTFSISYQEKSNDFMKDFGLREYTNNLKELNPTYVASKVFKLIENKKNISNQISEKLATFQNIIRNDIKLLK